MNKRIFFVLMILFLLLPMSVYAADIPVKITRIEVVRKNRIGYYNACIDGGTYTVHPIQDLKLGDAIFTTKRVKRGTNTITVAVLRQGRYDYSFSSTGRNC